MSEEYNFNWPTFSEHLQLMFKELYQEKRYADITLVTDDQTQFKAHKFVLSACSQVFRKIIENNPIQNPLIYLRGIQSYEIETILQFMYHGEGKSHQERIGEFIKAAKDLEIKDIGDIVEMQSDEEITFEEEDETKAEIVQQHMEPQILDDVKENQHEQCSECEASFSTRILMLLHWCSLMIPIISNLTVYLFITRMEVPGEYCDHIFIQKMAEIIKRDLIIIFVQPGAGFRRLPGGPGGTEMIEKQPVFLAYYDEIRYAGGHYQALEPISEETWRSFPPNLSTVTSANFRPSATSTGSAPPEKRTRTSTSSPCSAPPEKMTRTEDVNVEEDMDADCTLSPGSAPPEKGQRETI